MLKKCNTSTTTKTWVTYANSHLTSMYVQGQGLPEFFTDTQLHAPKKTNEQGWETYTKYKMKGPRGRNNGATLNMSVL